MDLSAPCLEIESGALFIFEIPRLWTWRVAALRTAGLLTLVFPSPPTIISSYFSSVSKPFWVLATLAYLSFVTPLETEEKRRRAWLEERCIEVVKGPAASRFLNGQRET